MSESEELARPKRIGSDLEEQVARELDAINLVSVDECDAITTRPIHCHEARVPVTAPYDGVGGEGTPVEIKATRRRVSMDNRRGRWYFRHQQHAILREIDGVYALVVYDEPRRDRRELAAIAILPARDLDWQLAGRWSPTPGRPSEWRNRRPWDTVIDPGVVERGGDRR